MAILVAHHFCGNGKKRSSCILISLACYIHDVPFVTNSKMLRIKQITINLK